MRARALLVALALGAASCGGDDADGPPRETGPPPLRVELWGHDLNPNGPPTLIHGGRVVFTGVVAGGVPGERRKLVVELLGRADGTKRWRRAGTTHPNRVDSIQIGTRPRRNMTYRFRIAGHPAAVSRSMRIYVDLKPKLTASLVGAGTVELRYDGRGTAPVRPARGRLHFYLREDGRGPLRHRGSARAVRVGPGAVMATLTYSDPAPGDADRFYVCQAGQVARGYGHPRPADEQCGDRTVRATKRRLGAPDETVPGA